MVSRLLRILTITVLVLSLFVAPVAARPQSQVDTALSVGVNDNANLRSGPSTAYERVGAVLMGAEIQVDGCDTACEWYRLTTGEWIAGFLLDNPPVNSRVIMYQRQSARVCQQWSARVYQASD